MTTCDCRRTQRDLGLIEEAIEAVLEAVRLLPEDEHLREEQRLLLDLQARIEERLAVLAACASSPLTPKCLGLVRRRAVRAGKGD